MDRSKRFWNPYLAGLALGLVLLTSFLVMGKGLGASGAAYHLGGKLRAVWQGDCFPSDHITPPGSRWDIQLFGLLR